MKLRNKRILILLLALVMICGMMSMTAFAAQEAESVCDHTYENGICTGCSNEELNPYAGKTIACVGDSITYAYGVTKDETDYVTLLAKKLGMNYIRLGVSGTTLCTDGSRTCNIGKLTESNLNGADVVTIAMGINDFCAAGTGYYELGDINSTDASTIYGAMRMWCERIEELQKTDSLSDTQFYFLTPVITSWNNSVTSSHNWDQSKTNIHGYTLRDLCNAIINVCALYNVGVIDLNLLSGMYYVDAQDNNISVFGGDGVHPGEVGHEMMANAIANVLLQNDLRDDHTHHFGSWITTTWPYGHVGEEKRVCSTCSATESRDIHLHIYTPTVIAPTCTQQGYTVHRCVSCYYSYVDAYVDATGEHTDSNEDGDHLCDVCNAENVSEHTGGTATCKDKAICTVCNTAYGNLNANNHVGGTYLKDAAPANCYKGGYTGDTYCNSCHAKIGTGTETPATGNHIYTHACDAVCDTVGCGHTRPVPHFFGGEWQKDADYHWRICQTAACGALEPKALHTYGNDNVCDVCAYTKPVDKTLGDVNDDTIVNSDDAVAILRYLAGYDSTGYDIANGDYNKDGVTNSDDAVAILRMLAGYND